MNSTLCRTLAPAVLVLAVVLPAQAQAPQSQACVRLESQLASFDRSTNDPSRVDQVKRYEDALSKQQGEVERLSAQSKRLNCEGGFFVLFGGQAPQCGPINNQLQQMRANVERIQADLARLQGANGPEQQAQRRAILVALSQNDCGPQYRAQVAATQPSQGFFESLFGSTSILAPVTPGDVPTAPAGTFRTLCVRTCDGYYYPISFATVPARFADDLRTCQRACPAAEVQLYSHRNPGEDVNQAVSMTTQTPYTALPTAFKYRQAFDAACSCRKPGETWAQALKPIEDSTIERGDIVVNEEAARRLSQPAPTGPAARTNTRPDQRPPAAVTTPAAAPTAAAAETSVIEEGSAAPDPKRKVRSVGPTFLPTR